MELDRNEEQAFKGALLSAMHQMAKLVQEGSLVSGLDFKEMMEQSQQVDIFLAAVDEILYVYKEYDGPNVAVYCSYKEHRYRGSFYMAEPPGKFKDRAPIPHNISVEKFIRWDEYMEENIWETF
jgi:hypothetical protein